MIHGKNGLVFTGKAADGTKEKGNGKRGGFFRRLLASCRARTPAERIARGDALFDKACRLADKAGKGKPPLGAVEALTEALKQYTAAYHKTSKKYNGSAGLTESEGSETLALMRKARAGRAVCYYELGRLHERRHEFGEARSYYSEAERVKSEAIFLNANYPDDRTTKDTAIRAMFANERLRQD